MAPKLGKLGIRQKLGLAKATAKSKTTLKTDLVGLYARGSLAAGDVGRLAQSALQSTGASSSDAPADIRALAKARPRGSRARTVGGKATPDTHNSARALSRTLEKDCQLDKPYTAEIPMWDKTKCQRVMRPMAFLPIHEVIEKLVPVGAEEQYCSFGDDCGFQTRLQGWGERVGVGREELDRYASIALWGDSAPHSKTDSLNLLTWTLLSGPSRRRIWLCAFPKRDLCQCGCLGRHTYDGVLEVVGWMLRAMLAKAWPKVDHTGKPFPASSWRASRAGDALRLGGACIAKFGDWAWFKGVLGLRGWRGEGAGKSICWICQAGFTEQLHCYDFRASASWRSTLLSQAEFWDTAHEQGHYISKVWCIPGFHLSQVRPDWMHVVDLGTLQYLQGNLLWEMFVEVGGSFRRAKETVGKLENMMIMCAGRLGVARPLHHLTIGMFRAAANEKPKLRAKAAEGRHLLPVVREMLATCFDVTTPHARLRLQCVDALLKCYHLLDNWAQDSPVALARAAREHLLLLAELRSTCHDDLRWCLYPKHHIFIHLAEGATSNPRAEWNYGDESEIGEAVKLASRVSPTHIAVQLMPRYMNLFVL